MRRTLLTRPFILLIAALSLFAGTAGADPVLVPDETTFYLNWEECGAASRYELSTSSSSLNGCGPAGGIPLGEAFALLGESDVRTYASIGDGLPLTLDASRTVDGEVHIHSWSGLTGAGVGQVVVNGTLTARLVRPGETKSRTVTIGSFTGEEVATPQSDTVSFPFSLDVADIDDLAQVQSLSLDLEVRGVFADSGVQTNGGLSQLTIPTFVEDAS